ncbi:MAG: hypothetical protein LBH48_05075 [Bifidobacteriaceae bacterium]|jgi:hypothetical protein|nr:hypothetical protein [Bifidobacteriaceae bacterium]
MLASALLASAGLVGTGVLGTTAAQAAICDVSQKSGTSQTSVYNRTCSYAQAFGDEVYLVTNTILHRAYGSKVAKGGTSVARARAGQPTKTIYIWGRTLWA